MEKPKERKAKYEYDFIEDVVYVIPRNRKYSSSFRVDNFIFDMDNKKQLTGLEILNASKVMRIPKIFLRNPISGMLEVVAKKDKIFIRLEMLGVFRNQKIKNIIDVERMHENHLNPSITNFDIQPIGLASQVPSQ